MENFNWLTVFGHCVLNFECSKSTNFSYLVDWLRINSITDDRMNKALPNYVGNKIVHSFKVIFVNISKEQWRIVHSHLSNQNKTTAILS